MQQNLPKISIIVPVYNVERYLSRCIESILAQSYIDFELLLVNDGSQDNCAQICDSYAFKDLRVRVFHKINGGVSSARNLGLDNALGEWVFFIDSDDWLELDCLEVLVNEVEKDELDCLQYSYRKVDESGNLLELNSAEVHKTSFIEYEKRGCYLVSICGMFFKRSIAIENNIKFSESLKLAEDQIFVMSVLKKSNSVKRIPNVLYNYLLNTKSATQQAKFDDICDSIIALDLFEYRTDFYKHINYMIIVQILNALSNSECDFFYLYRKIRKIKIDFSVTNRPYNSFVVFINISKFNLFISMFIMYLYYLIKHHE